MIKRNESTPTAYVNGEITKLEDAKIPILDRGFLFGDGIYEVLKIYNTSILFFNEHWERLQRSLDGISLKNPLTKENLYQIILNLLNSSQIKNGIVYIQITRGFEKKRCDFPEPQKPSIIVFVDEYDSPTPQDYLTGVKIITVPHIRWAWNYLKTINLIPRVLMRKRAINEGAYEAVFVSEDSSVLEGTSSNIFIVKDEVIITPPINKEILEGVTRNVVLKIACQRGFNIEERRIAREELYISDEIFLTGTTTEILGVVMVDDRKIRDGKVGETTRKLRNLYNEYIDINLFK